MKTLTLLSIFLVASAIHAEQPQGRFYCTIVLPTEPGKVHQEELDCVPFAFPQRQIEYPSELRGSGIVGRIGILVWIADDGSLKNYCVTGGNEIRFMKQVSSGIKALHFSIPMKGGKPVLARVSYTIVISEREPTRVELPQLRPNKAPEPTPTSVTDRADARSAPDAGVAHL